MAWIGLFVLGEVSGRAEPQAKARVSASSPRQPLRKFVPPPLPAPTPKPEAIPVLPPPPPIQERTPAGPKAAAQDLEQIQLLLGRMPLPISPPPVWATIRAIVGFVGLLTLAYLGGHPRVQAWERRLELGHVMTTGFPFALLGMVASLPQVGILTPPVVRGISPLLPLGLGWIGFVIGSRFDARGLDRIPGGADRAAFGMTAASIAIILLAGVGAIAALRHQYPDLGMVRDAALLALAGATTARVAPEFLHHLLPAPKMRERLAQIFEFDQYLGILGILLLSVYYRPHGEMVAWQLPGTAWLFITLGLGTAMGALVHGAFVHVPLGPQFAAVLLGSAAFTSGIASYLRIAPLSVCFIAGAIALNLGGKWKQEVAEVFVHLERPIYFLFMIIAGAMWRPWEWQGWVLMVLLVMARFVARFLSSRMLRHWGVPHLEAVEQRALTAAPMGALSIAIIISAQDLYAGPVVPWIVTAVLAGSVVTEIGTQMAVRRILRKAACFPEPRYGTG